MTRRKLHCHAIRKRPRRQCYQDKKNKPTNPSTTSRQLPTSLRSQQLLATRLKCQCTDRFPPQLLTNAVLERQRDALSDPTMRKKQALTRRCTVKKVVNRGRQVRDVLQVILREKYRNGDGKQAPTLRCTEIYQVLA